MKIALAFIAIPASLLLATQFNASGTKAVATESRYASVDTMRKDPVCGMSVDDAKVDTVHYKNGQIYGFCSKHCKESFAANPEKYTKPKPKN